MFKIVPQLDGRTVREARMPVRTIQSDLNGILTLGLQLATAETLRYREDVISINNIDIKVSTDYWTCRLRPLEEP
jgi:hypothetical protein